MSSAASNLKDVSDEFKLELNEIEAAFRSSEKCDHVTRYSMQYSPHADGCVVSLWDAWNRMLRALVMLSASGPTTGITGTSHNVTTARNEAAVLRYLAQNKNNLRIKLIEGEPNWYDTRKLASIANGLGLSNANNITAAIGASHINLGQSGSIANPLEDIRLIRNFIAHKTNKKQAAVRHLNGFDPGGNIHTYLWKKTSGGVETFLVWTNSLGIIAETCCI